MRARINQVLFDSLKLSGAGVTAPTEVQTDWSLANDLSADSLDLLVVLSDLEEEFNTHVPDDVWENWRTVEDIYEYFESVGG